MSSFTNQTKNVASYTDQTKNSASWTDQGLSLTTDDLLLEDGGFLLLETGDNLLLETSSASKTSYTNQTKN